MCVGWNCQVLLGVLLNFFLLGGWDGGLCNGDSATTARTLVVVSRRRRTLNSLTIYLD